MHNERQMNHPMTLIQWLLLSGLTCLAI